MADFTLIIPDIHAGWEHSRVDELAGYLDSVLDTKPPSRLIFLGDVFDLWRASEADALTASRALLDTIEHALTAGISVEYLLGNHDFTLLDHLGAQSGLVAHLPVGIRYHHRYFTFQHQGKSVLVAHGDDCDFLYLALERLDPWIPIDLNANHVYDFYRWIAEVRPERIQHLSKTDLRELFINYVLHLPQGNPRNLRMDPLELEAFPGSFGFPLAPKVLSRMVQDAKAHHQPETVLANLRRLSSIWDNFVEVNLDDVGHRLDTAFTYTEVKNYNPFETESDISTFFYPDHIVVGHFHQPRQNPYWCVTDAGSWVNDPKNDPAYWSGSWVEISDGEVRLVDVVNDTLVGTAVQL